MLLVGTLKSPKLWNRFVPALVPPVMSYWVLPPVVRKGSLTRVFRPDGVMGEAAWSGGGQASE